ncbi:GNAT family N-acetyltransferase [Maritimibacter sp. UBA3975]|mgnify:CR=1 FL=1|uniref:GNAT family N-acetyltransferase n=1 Tax=Maritimibacter sp. UBA3975 TaxID=1946833 RepID=UPI000C0B6D57|nr:GNAT family N-acetyltransferase [Maritimibacter sp. UBA3975]MAM63352.1 isopropylmalate isomerase [Maritimibacter sp.]|tara:strand:+ start:8846 stop:9646 length:801 start_codon:yes stop_codon:yes gene_type:complete
MKPEDDPFFGDETTRALQAARDADVATMRDMPGAVVHARVLTADDPEAFGWDRLREGLAREGVVSVRGVTGEVILTAEHEFASLSPKPHFWDLFLGDADDVRAACGKIVAQGLPEGVTRQPSDEIDAKALHEMQAFLVEHGISPFSKRALAGELFPARAVILRNGDGSIAATAFAGLTHNHHSWLSGVAWVGLAAVDPALRGLGLGKTVDAIANLVAVDELGASGTTEFAAADNAPSRAMLRACGLRHVPERMVVMFSASAQRLTA